MHFTVQTWFRGVDIVRRSKTFGILKNAFCFFDLLHKNIEISIIYLHVKAKKEKRTTNRKDTKRN